MFPPFKSIFIPGGFHRENPHHSYGFFHYSKAARMCKDFCKTNRYFIENHNILFLELEKADTRQSDIVLPPASVICFDSALGIFAFT